MKKVFFVAGEHSGDISASVIADILSSSDTKLSMSGVGGDCLRLSGVKLIDDIISYSSVGFLESIVPAFRLFFRVRSLVSYIRTNSVDIVILVDNQGINIKLAALARRAGAVVVYYFPPHISIWGGWNARKLAKRVDLLLCPFYKDYLLYKSAGANALYVGHYLPSALKVSSISSSFPVRVVGLFPGSRRREVRVHLPILLEAAHLLSKSFNLSFVLVISSKHIEDLVYEILSSCGRGLDIVLRHSSPCDGDRSYLRCDMAIAVSGTVCLELSLLQIPMLIIYKLSYISYIIGRFLLYTKHISIVNILLDDGLVPELLGNVKALEVFTKASEIISDRDLFYYQRDNLGRVRDLIYKEGSSDIIYDALSRFF